jgi:hypothetical protein
MASSGLAPPTGALQMLLMVTLAFFQRRVEEAFALTIRQLHVTASSGLAPPTGALQMLLMVTLAFFQRRVEETCVLTIHRLYIRVYRVGTDKNINAMDESFRKSFGKAQQLQGISLCSFVASVSLSAVIFTLEVVVFLIVRKRFPDL